MAYLLDADVLIRAKRDHYRFAVFPCFWDWIVAQSGNGVLYSVAAVKAELEAQADELASWAAATDGMFIVPDQKTVDAASRLSAWAMEPARPYTQDAVSTFFASADYWLIAHALGHDHTVVTHEIRAPQAKRRIKIPDVCDVFSVLSTTPFEMLQDAGALFP